MATGHPLLTRLEETVRRDRDKAEHLEAKLAHYTEKDKIVMQFLSNFGTALNTLISNRQASDERAATAEAKVADLEKQIAADEATLKGMLDEVNAENEAETPATSDPAPSSIATVTNPTPATTITVNPASATSAATDPSTGTATDPGTTTHVDATTGTTTTVDHATGEATATNAAGTTVTPDPSVVADATAATQAAGVTVGA